MMTIQSPDETATIAQLQQPWWLQILPEFIKNKLKSRTDLIGASDSLFWLSIDTGASVGLGFIVNILLARSLGPERFGYFSYLLAFFSIFLPISKLGLPNIIVRNLARNPENKDKLLGTGFFLRTFAGLATMFLATLAMFIIRPQDQLSQLLISFLGLMALMQASEVIEYYFQSKLIMKKLTLSKLVGVGTAVFLKITAILLGLPLPIVLFLWAVEAFFVALASVATYIKSSSLFKWKFDFKIAKQLLRQGTPLLFSSIVIMGYAQADQIFLNYFEGPATLGQYSVTVIILNGLAILPMVIQKAVAPVLMKANQEKHAELFNSQLQQLYRLMTIVSVVVGILLVFFGPFIITLLYGEAYREAGHILALLPFRFFFVSFGVIRSLYVVSHGLFDYDLVTNIAGVIVSVVGSVLLIPLYGIYGLLLASFFSLLTSTFLMDFFHKKLLTNATLALEAIVTPYKFTLD